MIFIAFFKLVEIYVASLIYPNWPFPKFSYNLNNLIIY